MSVEKRPSKNILTKGQKISLRKRVSPAKRENDSEPIGLPPISDDLRLELLRFLNLDEDANARWQQAQLDGDVYYPPVTLASQMVEDEFRILMTDCEPQALPIRDWVNSEFRGDLIAANSAAIGVSTVIKIYHLMYGGGFIERFKTINPSEIAEALRLEVRPPEERFSLISAATRRYRLPAYQFNLQFCLSDVGMSTPNYQAVIDGGTAIYRVLDKHASKIVPPVIS